MCMDILAHLGMVGVLVIYLQIFPVAEGDNQSHIIAALGAHEVHPRLQRANLRNLIFKTLQQLADYRSVNFRLLQLK